MAGNEAFAALASASALCGAGKAENRKANNKPAAKAVDVQERFAFAWPIREDEAAFENVTVTPRFILARQGYR